MMTPLQRAKLAQELSVKVQEISALPARTPGEDEGPLLLMKRIRLAKETNELLIQLFGDPGDDAVGRAQAYFRENLKGRVISTKIGDVRLLGSSFKEMKRGMKSDALKAALIRFVPEILTSGEYSGRLPLNKVRGDHFVAFHFFRKKVEVDGLSVEAGVNVGERDDGHLAWGLGHEFTPAWHKKKETPGSSRGNEPRAEGVSLDAASDTPEPNLHDTGEGVNIIILAVHDKNGNRMPELEDAPETDAPAVPAETDIPGMAVFIARSVEAGIIVDLRRKAARLPDGDRRKTDLLRNADSREKGLETPYLQERGNDLAGFIANKSVLPLLSRLSINNPNSKKAFTAITGVKLPATNQGTKEALAAWAGTTIQQVDAELQAQVDMRAAANRPKDMKYAVESSRRVADAMQIKFADGSTPTTGALWIESMISEGLTQLSKTGRGPVKKWGLFNPETRMGRVLPATILSAYAKALTDKLAYEKEIGTVLDAVITPVDELAVDELGDVEVLDAVDEALHDIDECAVGE